jgi:hypothetical protein
MEPQQLLKADGTNSGLTVFTSGPIIHLSNSKNTDVLKMSRVGEK